MEPYLGRIVVAADLNEYRLLLTLDNGYTVEVFDDK